MNVFNIIPSNFFSVLVSQNREIYVEVLMNLYELFEEEINIRLKAFLAEIELILENREYVIEDSDEAEETDSSSLRGKARIIERRLEKTGWIDREFLDGSFTEIITPKPYAITVMRMLKDLTAERAAEYNSLVFSTYSALNQAYTDNRDRMYEALIIARNNTEKLDYELRSFYHNIRSYLNVIRENTDVDLLLKNHFEEYKKLADRVYHPVKTMDSIFRYSGPIRNILTDVHYDEELLGKITEKAMVSAVYESFDDAKDDVLSMIDKIIDSYRMISTLMEQIDIKHCSLTRQSIDKIRYVISADQSIKGKLIDILRTYAECGDEDKDAVEKMLIDNVDINRQEYIDSGSFYHKSIRSRRSDKAAMQLKEAADFEDEIMEAVVDKIKKSYSDARVRAFMDSLFEKGNTTIKSEEIPIENDTDYILTLLSVVRAYKGKRGYDIELIEGSTVSNGYRIPRFVLSREEKQ